jgi:hypothetical protein
MIAFCTAIAQHRWLAPIGGLGLKMQSFRSRHKSRRCLKILVTMVAGGWAVVALILCIGSTHTVAGRTHTAHPIAVAPLSPDQDTHSKSILSGENVVPGQSITYRITVARSLGFNLITISDTIPNATTMALSSLMIEPQIENSGYDAGSRAVYFRADSLTEIVGTPANPIIITFAVKTKDGKPPTHTTYITNVARIDVPFSLGFPNATNVVTSTLLSPTGFLPLTTRDLCYQDVYEPNDTRAEADSNLQAQITIPATIDDAWFCPGDVSDNYIFPLSGVAIEFQLIPPPESDYDLWIIDKDGNVIKGSARIGNGVIESLILSPHDAADGSYYAFVHAAIPGNTAAQPYRLTLRQN